MLALVLSVENTFHLRRLCEDQQKSQSEDIELLRRQLKEPIVPDQEGRFYEHCEGAILTYECLIGVARWTAQFLDDQRDVYRLTNLMKGAQVAVPRRPKPVRSAALIEALAKIERQQEEKEYAAMISGVQPNGTHGIFQTNSSEDVNQTRKTEEEEWREVRQQISAIINVLLSVGAVVTAVWWAGGNASPIWKTLVALPLGLLVAVAETVLYARYWSNIEKRRDAAKSRRRS